MTIQKNPQTQINSRPSTPVTHWAIRWEISKPKQLAERPAKTERKEQKTKRNKKKREKQNQKVTKTLKDPEQTERNPISMHFQLSNLGRNLPILRTKHPLQKQSHSATTHHPAKESQFLLAKTLPSTCLHLKDKKHLFEDGNVCQQSKRSLLCQTFTLTTLRPRSNIVNDSGKDTPSHDFQACTSHQLK